MPGLFKSIVGHIAKEAEEFIGRATANPTASQPYMGQQPAALGSPAFGPVPRAAYTFPAPAQQSPVGQSKVVINGVQLSPADMTTLQMTVGYVVPGNYW
jgi:hypothetical protein